MKKFYIPYSGRKPSAVEINGHRLIMLAQDKESVITHLDAVGADRLKVVKVEDSETAEVEFFSKLSFRNHAGVVILPPEVSCGDMLATLEASLPWVQ
jgi:hypothetical protein